MTALDHYFTALQESTTSMKLQQDAISDFSREVEDQTFSLSQLSDHNMALRQRQITEINRKVVGTIRKLNERILLALPQMEKASTAVSVLTPSVASELTLLFEQDKDEALRLYESLKVFNDGASFASEKVVGFSQSLQGMAEARSEFLVEITRLRTTLSRVLKAIATQRKFASYQITIAEDLLKDKTKTMLFKAVYNAVPLRREPHPDSPIIGEIPKGTIVEVEKREKHWIQPVDFEGWGAATLMERIMDKPAPDLEYNNNGHKLIDGVFRNFFGINNIGLAEYSGNINLKLFSEGRLVHTSDYRMANHPISSPGGRNFHVDTDCEVDAFEFTDDDKTVTQKTKGLIS